MRRSIVITIPVLIVAAIVGWFLWRPNVTPLVQRIQNSVTSSPSVRFAVVGDNHGVNPVYRQILQDIKGEPFDFLLNLADTSEHGESAEFQAVKELESTLPFPVYHTVGSHDIKADPTRQAFLAAFDHDRWYAVDIGQFHLIVLDNADRKVGFPSEELDWLERDLAAHTSSVNVIAYHRPFDLPLASVLGDDETTASAKTNERFKAIIGQAKVQQIFTSHLHTYLSYTVAGVPAVVSGGGGDPAQFVLGGAKNNYFHYLDVTVKGSAIDITPVRVNLDAATAE